MDKERVNILLVDDQPAKLLSYEVILEALDETLLKANSATEAFRLLLRHDIAVILVDVSMPDLDGFQLATMIREHPRFKQTAIIFISAIHLSEMDSQRGYELGAVDYMSVPVSPELLRAKVRVFVDLYRKTRELEAINNELEARVAQRTSEVEAAIERQTLLAREVDHRARNTLAVIESIVSLTEAETIDKYIVSVRGRIRAMALAHTLLSQSRWNGADFRRLVKEELAPYASAARIEVEGGSILLRPAAAQSIAIAVHELATNAAKYGALSTDTGRLSVEWKTDGGMLTFCWREEGGPPTGPPRTEGFGMRVLASTVQSQLSGDIKFDWRESGLVCSFTLPERHLAENKPATNGAAQPVKSVPAKERKSIAGKRVLIVEDEALIGMMMAEYLSSSGVVVLGPVVGLREAFSRDAEEIDAAILDVNLGDATVYPFADDLCARGVPIVFVTGYENEFVDQRFNGAPVLQKPIELEQLHAALAAAVAAQQEQAAPPKRVRH